MKTLTEYKNKKNIISEDFFGNLGIGKKAKIEKWLKEHKIDKYTINDDLTIDAYGCVSLSKYPEKELPDYIQFNIIEGDFIIMNCPNLISLKGCPKVVDDPHSECTFDCSGCPKLISLEGCPESSYNFDCSFCPNLKSLEGGPNDCYTFSCIGCKKIKNLIGAPTCVNLYCDDCINLTSFSGISDNTYYLSTGGQKKINLNDIKDICTVAISNENIKKLLNAGPNVKLKIKDDK